MRKPTPLYIVASVAFALSATAAVAQLPSGGNAGPSPATGTTAAGTTAAGGSGVAVSNQTAAPRATPSDTSVGASRPSGGTGVSSVAGGGGGQPSNQATFDARGANSDSFSRGGSFANDSGNSALGQSPGQTSSGTAVGNSSPGLDVDSATLGSDVGTFGTDAGILGAGGVAFGTDPAFVPGNAAVDVNGQRVGSAGAGPGPAASQVTVLTTPTLDATVRDARDRMARQAAEGQPRIIGIAPRTDADLTDQMPDDRIIRY